MHTDALPSNLSTVNSLCTLHI